MKYFYVFFSKQIGKIESRSILFCIGWFTLAVILRSLSEEFYHDQLTRLINNSVYNDIFPLIIIHNFVSYTFMIYGSIFVLSKTTSKSPINIAKMSLYTFMVAIIVPLIDFLFAPQKQLITYLNPVLHDSWWVAFFTFGGSQHIIPNVGAAGVSLGQRIEVLLFCIFSFFYQRSCGTGQLKSLLGSTLTYFIIFFCATIPYFSQWFFSPILYLLNIQLPQNFDYIDIALTTEVMAILLLSFHTKLFSPEEGKWYPFFPSLRQDYWNTLKLLTYFILGCIISVLVNAEHLFSVKPLLVFVGFKRIFFHFLLLTPVVNIASWMALKKFDKNQFIYFLFLTAAFYHLGALTLWLYLGIMGAQVCVRLLKKEDTFHLFGLQFICSFLILMMGFFSFANSPFNQALNIPMFCALIIIGSIELANLFQKQDSDKPPT